MLDAELKEQLKSVFSVLENEVELVVELTPHGDLTELLNLLEGVGECSTKIKVTKAISTPGMASPIPRFHIHRQGLPTGVSFAGIPGGHEFSSLVVAILNADEKGKMPDAALRQRIKRLRGPIQIKTFISLTCENCPDVVQAMNQIALVHGQFKHEMVDGGYVEEEIKTLGLQGVPSLVVNNKIIHSGRINVLDLLAKLETEFGVSEGESKVQESFLGKYDVVVIGGGPAGASAAIYSSRKGLKTAILAEKIGGQVQETRGIENLISVPYTEGPQLVAQLAQHMAQYPIDILEHRRVKSISKEPGLKIIALDSGESIETQAVIVATGAKWRELGVPGEKEYIGRGVAFCPHCDGPFYKGKKVAVIGGGNSGVEAAIDLAGIVSEVVLFEFNPELKADKVLVDKLKSLSNVTIQTHAKTLKILGDGQKVSGLEYQNRTKEINETVMLDGVFVQIGLLPNSRW
jgi:NADH-dependent peroxiredoxin subunit F